MGKKFEFLRWNIPSLLIPILFSCVPEEKVREPLTEDLHIQSEPQIPKGCVVPECDDDGALPMGCTLSRVGNQTFLPWQVLVGWGKSACAARKNLHIRACNEGLEIDDEAREGISCVPDVSEGYCSGLVNQCPDIGDQREELKYCFSRKYQGRALSSQLIFGERGPSDCVARFRLSQRVCQLGLDPRKLGPVACMADSTAGECSNDERKSCSVDYYPFNCEGSLRGGILKRPELLNVFAENSCFAEARFANVACSLNIPPSSAKDYHCFEEN